VPKIQIACVNLNGQYWQQIVRDKLSVASLKWSIVAKHQPLVLLPKQCSKTLIDSAKCQSLTFSGRSIMLNINHSVKCQLIVLTTIVRVGIKQWR